jgi:hypothetical protein
MSHTKYRFILAFVAGFLSVLLFHQGMLALLHALAIALPSPGPTPKTTATLAEVISPSLLYRFQV